VLFRLSILRTSSLLGKVVPFRSMVCLIFVQFVRCLAIIVSEN